MLLFTIPHHTSPYLKKESQLSPFTFFVQFEKTTVASLPVAVVVLQRLLRTTSSLYHTHDWEGKGCVGINVHCTVCLQ